MPKKHASCTALHTYNMYMAEIDTQKHTETRRDTQKHTETHRSTYKHKDRQRQTETDRDRQRQTEKNRDRQRQTETDTSIEYTGSTHMCICKTACADLQNI